MRMSGKHRKPSRWRHPRSVGQQAPRPRWSLPEMVDGDDVAHLVTSDAYETGLRERTGHYRMVCGRRITVGSMAAAPNRYCRPCQVLAAGT